MRVIFRLGLGYWTGFRHFLLGFVRIWLPDWKLFPLKLPTLGVYAPRLWVLIKWWKSCDSRSSVHQLMPKEFGFTVYYYQCLRFDLWFHRFRVFPPSIFIVLILWMYFDVMGNDCMGFYFPFCFWIKNIHFPF